MGVIRFEDMISDRQFLATFLPKKKIKKEEEPRNQGRRGQITVLKRFAVFCYYGFQGWTWIETFK